MLYVLELTKDEVQALDETLKAVRKGGDARLIARSKPGASLARKTQELHAERPMTPLPPVSLFGRHADGRHYAEVVSNAVAEAGAHDAEVRRITTLLPPPLPSVVAPTTVPGSE